MFLFPETRKIGGKTNLGLDLLFAVTEVIVRQHRDHHTAGVPKSELEGVAVVVKLVWIFIVHPIPNLPLGRLVFGRKIEHLFGGAGEVRGNNDAPCVSGPIFDVEAGVVFRKERIACISENAFDKIEVGHASPGSKKAHLHGFLPNVSLYSRANHWP